MNILNKIDWNILKTYINNKFINANKHPEYDIWILNYTPNVQFERNWDEYTINCRGLIIDIEGNIISRCLKKFFNYEELKSEEIPNESFDVYEKMDGSYIVIFYYNNERIFASRGSFISEQAIMAKNLFNVKYKNKVILNSDYNYILELIGNCNKIVIDYPENDLILLTVFDKNTGGELSIYDEVFNGFNRVKKYDNKNDFNTLKSLISNNAEGFVVRFKNGFRMKIKGDEYIRLHRIVTNVSNLTIWEHLKDNRKLDELLEKVPDEFYNWVNKTVTELKNSYNEIERLALKEFVEIYYNKELKERKEFALEALKSKYSPIIFNLYSKKQYDKFIYKMIRPIYSKPFKDGFDDV